MLARKKMTANFIEKNGILGPKKNIRIDEKLNSLNYLKNQNLKNYLQTRVWKIILKIKKMRKWDMTSGPKVAMQKWGHACGSGM